MQSTYIVTANFDEEIVEVDYKYVLAQYAKRAAELRHMYIPVVNERPNTYLTRREG